MAARNKAKAAGGRWNPDKQLWFVKYGNIVGTALVKYIDVDASICISVVQNTCIYYPLPGDLRVLRKKELI
jgi:hypothetical protein